VAARLGWTNNGRPAIKVDPRVRKTRKMTKRNPDFVKAMRR